IPQIKPWRPQASFLVWLDCRALGLNHQQLVDLFVKQAHLALNDGEMFGTTNKNLVFTRRYLHVFGHISRIIRREQCPRWSDRRN
ncbi:MAG: hypothetical protein MR724_04365, partial [Prevotella sp.]|nr:hypothetical protein [Prevotella sp.]